MNLVRNIVHVRHYIEWENRRPLARAARRPGAAACQAADGAAACSGVRRDGGPSIANSGFAGTPSPGVAPGEPVLARRMFVEKPPDEPLVTGPIQALDLLAPIVRKSSA
jgi:hypothetical protein